MKKNKRILSTLIALVLLCAMTATTAYADVPSSLTVDAVTENGTINLTKYLVVDKDAPVPAVSFSFSLAPETVADNTNTGNGLPVYTGPAVTDGTATVTFANGDTTTDGAADDGIADDVNKKYATGTATLSLAGAAFTKPGAYRYGVTETTTGGSGLTVDSSKFIVDVYVGYATPEGGSESADLSILQVIIKKDGSGDKSEIAFKNIFASRSLTVTKTVAGNMGDRTKEFSFTLNLTANDKLTSGTTVTAVKTAQNGTTSNVTVTVGSDCTFTLKHGETLAVPGLPEGTSYTVTETKDDDYTTTVASTGGTGSFDADNNKVSNTMGSTGNTEAFTNTASKTVDTGIILDIAPYIIIFIIAIVGAILFFGRKRKKVTQ